MRNLILGAIALLLALPVSAQTVLPPGTYTVPEPTVIEVPVEVIREVIVEVQVPGPSACYRESAEVLVGGSIFRRTYSIGWLGEFEPIACPGAPAPAPEPGPDPTPDPTPQPPPASGALFRETWETFPTGSASWNPSNPQNGYNWSETWGEVRAAPGGGKAWRMDKPASSSPGQRSNNANIRIEGPGLTEFWFDYTIRIPDNYAHTFAGNNKWVEFFNTGNRDAHLVAPNTWNRSDGGSSLSIASMIGGVDQSHIGVTDSWITPADRGKWVRMRFHVRLGTPGQSNGTMRIWKNDSLVFDRSNLKINGTTASNNPIGAFQIMGWDNSGWPSLTEFFVDNVALYGQNPGW